MSGGAVGDGCGSCRRENTPKHRENQEWVEEWKRQHDVASQLLHDSAVIVYRRLTYFPITLIRSIKGNITAAVVVGRALLSSLFCVLLHVGISLAAVAHSVLMLPFSI